MAESVESAPTPKMDSVRCRNRLGYTHELVKPNLFRTHIPSLPFVAFGSWFSGEKFLPWHLIQLNDSAEAGTTWTPTMDERISMIFAIYTRIDIDESFYSIESPKHPLVMDREILSIGRSSKYQQATLYHSDAKVPYVTITDIDVNIDPDTRRPIPFPDSWKQKYELSTELSYKVKKADVTKPDIGVVQTCVQVRFSEIDENKHTNYSEYLKFAYNSFCENMLSNRYRNDIRHLFNGGVKMVEMAFKQESLLGDVLSIESWEDILHSDTYHFELNKGKTTCCFVTMQFFSNGTGNSRL